MSAVLEIIEQAKSAGIKLAMEDGQLMAEGPQEAVNRLLPILKAHKPELLAALFEAGLNETSGHWLIIEPPTKTERWFTPPVTRSELESRYPVAILIPLPDTAPEPAGQRKLLPTEMDELTRLIPIVARHYDCPPEELAEMRTAAARDPAAALESFRAMARGFGPEHTERAPGRFLTADQWLSLGERKNPPVLFAKQANIAAGPQQVNNGVPAEPSRGRETEIEQSKLSGDGQRFNTL